MDRAGLDLRLIVITDRRLAAPRSVPEIVRAAVTAGAPAIQLRDKTASARELALMAREIQPITRDHGALLFVNDRLDVALAVRADGAHLGPADLPIAAARSISPPGFLLGYSCDDPGEALQAQRAGADYIGCGALFGTRTKLDVAGEAIGSARLDEVARSVSIPVVGIGGITAANIARVASTGAAGAAVVSAIMTAEDPGRAVKKLLDAFSSR